MSRDCPEPVENGHTYAVVVNPRAGNGRMTRLWPSVRHKLDLALGPSYRVLETQYPGHATLLVRQALQEGYDRIVSAGGDGTNNEVLNGFFEQGELVRPEAAMALLPMGTGSDLARMLSIPRGEAAIERLRQGRVMAADVGRATFTLADGSQKVQHFINTCHVGMGGAVAHQVNTRTKRFGGFVTYLWSVLSTLATYENKVMRLTIDGHELEQKCRDIIIANGQFDGGGMHVAPNARLDSGLFDIYVLGDMSAVYALTHVPAVYRGRLHRYPRHVQIFSAARISIEATEPLYVNLDGEQPGQTPATFEMLAGSLRLVV